jgi:WW domain
MQSLPYGESIHTTDDLPEWTGDSEGEAIVPAVASSGSDWAKVDDPAGTYYYNQATGECVWDRPEGFTTPMHADIAAPDKLGSNWVTAWDETNQCEYYYNQV